MLSPNGLFVGVAGMRLVAKYWVCEALSDDVILIFMQQKIQSAPTQQLCN